MKDMNSEKILSWIFFSSDVENTNVYHSKYYAPSITCITYKQILKTTSVPDENI